MANFGRFPKLSSDGIFTWRPPSLNNVPKNVPTRGSKKLIRVKDVEDVESMDQGYMGGHVLPRRKKVIR
jgi:hypothetical protein